MSELQIIVRKSELDANPEPVQAPPSKSDSHRALIAAALTPGKTRIQRPLRSEDTQATIEALKMLGTRITARGDDLEVDGTHTLRAAGKDALVLDCRESGTTLRLLTPIAALAARPVTLTGKAGLLQRPTEELVDALAQAGANVKDSDGKAPVLTHGGLHGGKIKIRGDVSSQFISGLLFALPLVRQDSGIEVTTAVESLPYIQMTLATLEQFGIKVEHDADFRKLRVAGRQKYKSPGTYLVEGDYSSAAFLAAAGALCGPQITISGLNEGTLQADAVIADILRRMGADVERSEAGLKVMRSIPNAIDIDVKDAPDLVPILAVLATQAKGKTKITNAGRLRLKESDRLAAITTELRKMGAEIEEGKDHLLIYGPTPLHGAVIDPHNDHRIAMACAIAGLMADGETVIGAPEVIAKSYPDFFYHLRQLGATVLSQTAPIGERFRIQLYGGSHEKCVGLRMCGLPLGLIIDMDAVRSDLDKRRPFGSLTTPRREKDELRIVKGIDPGQVNGPEVEVNGPEVAIEIENRDVNPKPYEMTRFTPRPNHGDYTTAVKYRGIFDFRGGGFLSARMTTATVIAGSIAKQLLARQGIAIAAYVKQIGTVRMEKMPTLKEAQSATYNSEMRCPDSAATARMKAAVETARAEQDSLGGIIECQVHGLPVGIGEPIFNALDSVLAHHLFSIPAVKGVEFGSGFAGASCRGSGNNDAFAIDKDGRIVTTTNHSGGIQGGISNGMPLLVRVAIKPTSSIAQVQKTVDMRNGTDSPIHVLGRHDPCVAIRAPIIVENTVAIALLDMLLRR